MGEIQNMVETFVGNGFLAPRLYRMILNFCTIEFFPDIGFSIEELGYLLNNFAFNKNRKRGAPMYNLEFCIEDLEDLLVKLIVIR